MITRASLLVAEQVEQFIGKTQQAAERQQQVQPTPKALLLQVPITLDPIMEHAGVQKEVLW